MLPTWGHGYPALQVERGRNPDRSQIRDGETEQVSKGRLGKLLGGPGAELAAAFIGGLGFLAAAAIWSGIETRLHAPATAVAEIIVSDTCGRETP